MSAEDDYNLFREREKTHFKVDLKVHRTASVTRIG